MALPPSAAHHGQGSRNSANATAIAGNNIPAPAGNGGRRLRASPFISWLRRGNDASAKKLASPAEEIKMVFLRQLVLSDLDLDGTLYHSVFTGAQIVDIILNHFALPDRKLAANVASRLIDCSLYTHVSGPSCSSHPHPMHSSASVIDSNAEIYTLTPEAQDVLKSIRKSEAMQRAKTQTRKKYMDLRGHLLHPLSSDAHSPRASSASNDACSSRSWRPGQSKNNSASCCNLDHYAAMRNASSPMLPPPLDVHAARNMCSEEDVALDSSRTASPYLHSEHINHQVNDNGRRSADSPADTLVAHGPINAVMPSPAISTPVAHAHTQEAVVPMMPVSIGSPLQQIDIPTANLDGLLNTWSFIAASTDDDEDTEGSKGSLSKSTAMRKSVPSLRADTTPETRRGSAPTYTEPRGGNAALRHIDLPIDSPIRLARTIPLQAECAVVGPDTEYQPSSSSHRISHDSTSIEWAHNGSSVTRRRWGIMYSDARDAELAMGRRSLVYSSPAPIYRCPSAPSLTEHFGLNSEDGSYASAFRGSVRFRARNAGVHRHSLSLSQYNDESGWTAEHIGLAARASSRYSDLTIASSFIGTQFRGPLELSNSSFASGSAGQSNSEYQSLDLMPNPQKGKNSESGDQESFVSYCANPSVRFPWNQPRRTNLDSQNYVMPIHLDYQQSRDHVATVASVESNSAVAASEASKPSETIVGEKHIDILSSDNVGDRTDTDRAQKSISVATTTSQPYTEDPACMSSIPSAPDAKGSEDGLSVVYGRASSVTLGSTHENRLSGLIGMPQQPTQRQRVSISAEPTCGSRLSHEMQTNPVNRASVHSSESSGSPAPGSSIVGGCMQLNLWRNTVSSDLLQSLSHELIAQQEAIYEIICTEQGYLRDLELIDIVFALPLLGKPDVMPPGRAEEFLKTLFFNYAELIENSRRLTAVLEGRGSESPVVTGIADIFDKWANNLQPFIEYSVHVPVAQCELEAELLTNKELGQFLAEAEAIPEARRLPIQSFIGRPATRFARYPLLLNAVIKRSLECGAKEDDDEIQLLKRAVERVRQALTEIDRRTGEGAMQLRIRQIGQRLRLVEGARESLALDSSSRKLIKEGLFYTADGAGQVLVFLFDNSLIMATEEKVPYAKGVTRYIADERIIPISMLDVSVSAADSGTSALMGIREALGLNPSTTAMSTAGTRPVLLRHASSASSMKNKMATNGGGSTIGAHGRLALTFVHIGCRSLCSSLFASSEPEREQWLTAVHRRVCIPQTLVEAYTDFRVLSDRDFPQTRGPLCTAPFMSSSSPGCQMILFGNKDGLHMGIYGVPTSVVKVSNTSYVTKIHILRKYNIVLVLSDSNLLVYSLLAIEKATAQLSTGVVGTKIASSVGFFDVGTYMSNPLIVLMKPRGSKSHFKCIQPAFNPAIDEIKDTCEDGKARASVGEQDGSRDGDSEVENAAEPSSRTKPQANSRLSTTAVSVNRNNGGIFSAPAPDNGLPTLRVVYQGNRASLRLISEFIVPGKTKRVHFLRRKLCIVGAKSFEIVDVQQSRVLRSLPDPLDDDFSFVHNNGSGSSAHGSNSNNDNVSIEGSSGQALAICKVGREFLLCYESFAFYIDNFGRRSRPDIFIRWEMRPQIITFRHPYIVAINPKFLEIRHMETGVLLSIIRMRKALCLNPDSKSTVLHMAIGPGPVGIDAPLLPSAGPQKPAMSSTSSVATSTDVVDKGADSAIASATASTTVSTTVSATASAAALPCEENTSAVPTPISKATSRVSDIGRPTSAFSSSIFKSMSASPSTLAGGSGNNAVNGSNVSLIVPSSHIVPGLAGTSGKRLFPEGTPSHYRIIEIRLPQLKSSSSSSSLPGGDSSRKPSVSDAAATTAS
ncbi:hypothetical protein BX070DRAFT_220785 [Coemansia spiralis]|nr:hypothetical protein BX070DRAFT_220785 [Coemansia spiralis]